MFMFGKKTKSQKDIVAKKLIEDFPLPSRVRENFVEHFKLKNSCDTEDKLLQITQKLNQTSNFESAKLLTAFETVHNKTNQHKALQLDNNGFILEENRERRSNIELGCWYLLFWCV